jgi:hypothetical protein
MFLFIFGVVSVTAANNRFILDENVDENTKWIDYVDPRFDFKV